MLQIDIDADATITDDGIELRFPWDGDAVRVVHALTGEVASIATEDFTFETFGHPASTGVVGLDGDTWLVPDQTTVHLATRLDRTTAEVVIHDETLHADATATWQIHVAGTAEEAIEAGLLLNVKGPVAVTLPPVPGDDDDAAAGPAAEDGCTCTTTPHGPAGSLVLILLLATRLVRRGRF